MEKASRGRATNLFYLALYFSLIFLGMTLAAIILIADQQHRSILLDVISPVVGLLACIVLFIAAKYSAVRSKRQAIAWGIIALAMVFYTLGDTIWAILEIGLNEQPFPSLADGFYLAYFPVFLIGVFLLQEKLSKPSDRIIKVTDAGIVILAAILGYWNFLIGPIIKSNLGLPPLEQIILLAYPVSDLVLFGALLVIIYNHSIGQDETSIFLLSGSILAMILTDSIYSYQSLLGIYVSGGFLDLGWIVSCLLAGLAGLSQLIAVQSMNIPKKIPFRIWLISSWKGINPFLPYIWLVGAFVLLIFGGLKPLPMSFFALSIHVGAIIVLVLVRQIFTLNENHKLNAQLQITNLELQKEIAERKHVEVQLSYDSLHDAMTGLANRTLFLDRLGQAIEYTKRSVKHTFAVLFIDLDQFKVVNDSLGHLTGDQLLILVAQRLKESLRSSDTIARFGGDEFEILLDVTSEENSVLKVVEKIQKALQFPFKLEEHEVYITASIGIIMNLSGYDHAEDLLRDADIAMYRAKALGGGRTEIFNIEMRQQAYFRLEIENEIRVGLEKREFQIYYQPIVLLESNRLVGFEALIRWIHPKRGLLLPRDFLPIAEESGLIIPMGDWILNTACSQLKIWQERYLSLQKASISINISSKQLSHPNFFKKVVKAIETSGLGAEFLRLEITEEVLIKNYTTANEIFTRLRNLGIQLHIDDFGTGYSALGYLQHFPINAIKIDKSFINEIDKSQRGIELVRAIVSMAHELGMETIAEGIETGKQLSELQNLLCGCGQGFLLSEPIEAEAVGNVLIDLEIDQENSNQ